MSLKHEPSTQRTRKLREALMRGRPTICSTRAKVYTESFMETEGMPPALRQALAFDQYLTQVPIYIQDGELIVGNMESKVLGVPIFLEYGANWISEELETLPTRESDPYLVSAEEKETIKKVIGYWKGKTFDGVINSYIPDDCKRAEAVGIISCGDKKTAADGHFTPGYDRVLKNGLKGIIDDAQRHINRLDLAKPAEYGQLHFLEAVVTSDRAVIKFAERYAELAREKAAMEKDETRIRELRRIADVCAWVPANPARNFWEALQAVAFIMFSIQMESNGHSINMGRIDQYLNAYYEKDMANNLITKEQVTELLECWYLKLASISKVMPESGTKYFRGYQTWSQITIGGQKRDAQDATNDLSYIMLDVTGNLRLAKPSVSVRIHKNTPPEFMMKCLQVNKVHRGGMPAFYNDETAILTLVSYAPNLTKEDAYDWDVVGCVELGVMGKGTTPATFAGFMNGAKILEMALYGGKDPGTGIEVNPGMSMTAWNSYDEMMRAICKAMHECNRLLAIELNSIHYVRKLNWTLPYASSLILDCVERGRGHLEGGAISSPGGAPSWVGIANVGNSIAAIKKLVFEEKRLNMAQLKHALLTNFTDLATVPSGPEIRQMCLGAPKYGNDDNYVDNIIKEIARFQADDMHQNISLFATHFASALLPVSAHVPFGGVVGATPDGREAGMPLAEGCSPTQGSDVKGPTAAFMSVSKIDHVKHDKGTLYNVRIDPSSVENLSGMRKWADLVKTYFRLGGYHIQFNLTNAGTLRAAQRNPEEYRDLLVRVAGYSAFFVSLDKDLQEDLIARTEHKI